MIEPWLTDQWYVNAEELAKRADGSGSQSGEIEIVPKTWEKTFFNWMENIQPWCVSRQLWWGHRIPAWYGPTLDENGQPREYMAGVEGDDAPEAFVAESFEDAIQIASRKYACEAEDVIETDNRVTGLEGALDGANWNGRVGLWRDPDVLDTWFSSALWPFATLGWPEEEQPTPDPSRKREGSETCQAEGEASRSAVGQSLLNKHYPNDLLISGFDILFFWDARMAMQGMQADGRGAVEASFTCTGWYAPPDGQKMSKSKGNVVDPLLA